MRAVCTCARMCVCANTVACMCTCSCGVSDSTVIFHIIKLTAVYIALQWLTLLTFQDAKPQDQGALRVTQEQAMRLVLLLVSSAGYCIMYILERVSSAISRNNQ